MEFNLYKIENWQRPEWVDSSPIFNASTLYIELSNNPHPMSNNILYANFDELPQGFASWFYLNKDTIFLYEKLNAKYLGSKYTTLYNHRSASIYYQYTNMEKDITSGVTEPWKSRIIHVYICEHCPLREIEIIPFENLHWFYLSINQHKCVIDFLKTHPDKIHWKNLARNSCDAAVDFLLEESRIGRTIEWDAASINTNEKMIARFREVKEELNIFTLSQNTASSAVQFLLTELYDKINWFYFCKNPNDLVVDHILDILEKDNNDKRVIWESLSANTNPRIFPILEANQQKIKWDVFIQNPICFAYDYEKIRKRFEPLKREIQEIFLHPDNVMARIETEKTEGESDFEIVSRLDFN